MTLTNSTCYCQFIQNIKQSTKPFKSVSRYIDSISKIHKLLKMFWQFGARLN